MNMCTQSPSNKEPSDKVTESLSPEEERRVAAAIELSDKVTESPRDDLEAEEQMEGEHFNDFPKPGVFHEVYIRDRGMLSEHVVVRSSCRVDETITQCEYVLPGYVGDVVVLVMDHQRHRLAKEIGAARMKQDA